MFLLSNAALYLFQDLTTHNLILSSEFFLCILVRGSIGGTGSSGTLTSSEWEGDSDDVTNVQGFLGLGLRDYEYVTATHFFPLVVIVVDGCVFFGVILAN